MKNPALDAREQLGLTRTELGKQAFLGVQTLRYIELGTYGGFPRGLERILSDANPNVKNDWDTWKLQARMASKGLFEVSLEGFPSLGDIMHPHTEWREVLCGLSLNGYCEALCIPRRPVQLLEAGELRRMPSVIAVALTHVLPVGSSKLIELIKKGM